MDETWRSWFNKESQPIHSESNPIALQSMEIKVYDSPISPDDPLYDLLHKSRDFIEIEKLHLDSPTLKILREEGVWITVPLISHGKLIGLLNFVPRLSEQDYSMDDLQRVKTLAARIASALHLTQLAKQLQRDAQTPDVTEPELRGARIIQEALIPKEVPEYLGWKISTYWKPTREASGDFYDFFSLPDGRLGILMADVTDKGIPAVLLMATIRMIFHATVESISSPGEVLESVNELLCPDIPPNMFVACLYLVLNPATGIIFLANAGHNLPYKCVTNGMIELRATGMPLGLQTGMKYEDKVALLDTGESLVLYSDGLIEAHNPTGEMYGFPRLRQFVAGHPECFESMESLFDDLMRFTGEEWEQEDDAILVLIKHDGVAFSNQSDEAVVLHTHWRLLSEFTVASEPGNERLAMELVTEAVSDTFLSGARLMRMQTAVAEATMNAIEHGNRYQHDLPVRIAIYATDESLAIKITDSGGGRVIPKAVTPDIEAKLAGKQSPRGWGLFLIQSMVDEMRVVTDDQHHTLELIFHNRGGKQ